MAESEQKVSKEMDFSFLGFFDRNEKSKQVEKDVNEISGPTYVQVEPKKGEDSQGRAFVEVMVDETLEKKEFEPKLGSVRQGFENLQKQGIEAISDDKEIIISSKCGFVHAVYLAFNNHIPLCFGPDDLWNLIVQGVSMHIAQNAEKLRDKFVDFDGKKKLTIQRNNFVKGSPDNDWAGCFEEWSTMITDNIGEENAKRFIPEFSTTGALEKAMHELSLMDAMQSYFSYGCCTMCGISKVKLMGTFEDWRTLRKMVTALRKYDLDWWINYIEPVIDEILNTYLGKVNKKFWYTIYKEWSTFGSGATDYVTGWITHFFPYIDKKKRSDFWTLKELQGGKDTYRTNTRKSLDRSNVPNGVTHTPFTWHYFGLDIRMVIYGGFAGCEMDGEYVRPVLAWGVGADPQGFIRDFIARTMPLEKWDSETVVKWLEESDSCVKEYSSHFKERNICGEDLIGHRSLYRKLGMQDEKTPEGLKKLFYDFAGECRALKKVA